MGYLKQVGLSALLAIGWAGAARADGLNDQLARTFPTQSPVYIGYQKIAGPNTAHDDRQYLILDFRFLNKPDNRHLQAAVARICHQIIRDHSLLRKLDSQGYDEVSVAFDRRYQYDCL